MSFRLKYRVIFFILLVTGLPAAQAQLNLLGKQLDKALLLNAPAVGNYTLQDAFYRNYLQVKNGYPDERAAWIVYSDRENNTTYQNAGRENQPLASLNFMQACFVIGEKNDYLELVEYVPGVNMSKNRKIVADPKYLGWVHKSALLLWNRALRDKMTNHFFKAITAFGSERVFAILPQLVAGDSIRTFSDPFLNRQQGSAVMESLFYLYKESVDGNEYLVGPDPEFLPEQAAKAGLAWVSKDLVRIWGTKGFITLNPELEGHLPFYPFMAAGLPGNSGTTPIAVVTSSDHKQGSTLSHIFPILRYSTSATGQAQITTGLLTDVLDKGNNGILNLAGETLPYEAIRDFGINSAALNIVLVVAGGEKNRQYVNNLNALIESEGWKQSAGTYFNSIKMGAVVYGDYGSACQPSFTPLSADLQEVASFLTAQKRETQGGCDNGNYYQAVYQGISEAAKMLRNYRDESNIIVLYGAGTDESGAIGQAISGLSATKARLLVFQTHNIPNESAYVQFVGAAKDLISKSAYNIIELKKRYLVSNTYSNVVTGQVDYTRGSDTSGRVMFLDYPARALSQGYILFPDNGENMPPYYLPAYLDSLITSIGEDNRRIDNALHGALAQNGTGDTRVKTAFAGYFPEYSGQKLPSTFLKANTLRNQQFLLPARLSLAGSRLQSAQAGLSSGVLLSRREFTGFIQALTELGGEASYPDKEAVVRQILAAVGKAQEGQARITKPLRELTFTEAMGFVTGYFPMDVVWVQTTLDAYRTTSTIPVTVGTAFLEECRRKAGWLRDQYNNRDLQYTSNGNVYYLVKAPNLPVSPVSTAMAVEDAGFFESLTPVQEEIPASLSPAAIASPASAGADESTSHAGRVANRVNTPESNMAQEEKISNKAIPREPAHNTPTLDIGNINADLGQLQPAIRKTSAAGFQEVADTGTNTRSKSVTSEIASSEGATSATVRAEASVNENPTSDSSIIDPSAREGSDTGVGSAAATSPQLFSEGNPEQVGSGEEIGEAAPPTDIHSIRNALEAVSGGKTDETVDEKSKSPQKNQQKKKKRKERSGTMADED